MKDWIGVKTYNAQDTQGVSALNSFLPKHTGNGQAAPALAPGAGTKLKFKPSAPAPIIEEPHQPYKCICSELASSKKHLHPTIVVGGQHLCTADVGLLRQHNPKLVQALSLPQKFRPNQREDGFEQTLTGACEA